MRTSISFVPNNLTNNGRPWNYPIFLSAVPFIGAVAAGCCCVVKLSEISLHFSQTMAELVPKYLDTRAFRIVLGAVPETTRLLQLKCKISSSFFHSDPNILQSHRAS